jgi:hypothetical protein
MLACLHSKVFVRLSSFVCIIETLGLLVIGLSAECPAAETVEFTVDAQASLLTVEAVFSGIPLEPQDDIAPGGDTAHYSGEIIVDVDDPLAPTQIQFIEGTTLAEVTGNWLPDIGGGNVGDPAVEGDADPGDPAPGNYGLFLDAGELGMAWGSFRDLGWSIASELQALTDGSFNTGQSVSAYQGLWDTNVRSEALGDDINSDDVTGETSLNESLGKGTYTVQNGVARLELPISLYFPGTVEFTFEGTLVATAVVGPSLPGDFNSNGSLDVADIDALTQEVIQGTNTASFDLNSDGLVNGGDRTVWVQDLRQTWFGDANLDGEFNSTDLVDVLASGTYEADVDSTWGTGDFDGDARTNSGDLITALADGGYEIGPRPAPAAVPEPASPTMLALSWLAALAVRRGSFSPTGASPWERI